VSGNRRITTARAVRDARRWHLTGAAAGPSASAIADALGLALVVDEAFEADEG
jgi:hypothetical protein